MGSELDGPTEEDKAKALEKKIKAPLVWGYYEKRQLRIEDLQSNKFKEALAIMRHHFLNTEITFTMVNILDDSESVEEFLANAKTSMMDKASIVAVKESSEKVVAVLIQRIVDKDTFCRTFSRLKMTSGKSYSAVMKYYNFVESGVPIHEIYDTRRYVKIYSLTVKPKYQDRELMKFMYKCALKSARACKIYVVAGIFTSGMAQDIASEIGFIKRSCIFYQKYFVDGQLVFRNPGSGNYGATFMAIRIPEEEEEEEF